MAAPPLPDKADHVSTLVEAARVAVAKVTVSLPASVLSYDRTKQTATVRIAPSFARRTPGSNTEITRYPAPDIANVPVAFPGTGTWSITWPLSVGDKGRIVVCDRSIDEWKSTGATRTEPQDPRRFDLTDSVFCPDVRPSSAPIPAAGVDASAMVIRGAEIRLGDATATSFVALATLVDLRFAELAAIFAAWAPVSMDGGAALKIALTTLMGAPINWPASVAAANVKAK